MKTKQDTLAQQIIACQRCPRLLTHCEKVAREKRRMFQDEEYWGRPVPNFGDINAQLLIVGLAPAAHGANRTGRMFTGDQSGLWLYRALYRAGFSNQAMSENRTDGLVLKNAMITAVVHCAPPDNKPSTEEIHNCRDFLKATLAQARAARVMLALGNIAWEALWRELEAEGEVARPRAKFAHGVQVQLKSGRWLVGSYHPSQQNTFTGRLSEGAFDRVFAACRELLKSLAPG
ncbi:MAG: uracil-DNA glycosylase [Betaproteobacteria bacterium]|nr:uracil-DNA glycosylase [Betaproteobacteria bacterium]